MTTSRIKSYYYILFAFFLISGFCGLIYQVVWLRMAFATFGVITPILSVVISVFMLGLAVGSWLGGKTIEGLSDRTRQQPILFYGLAEFFIGTGGIVIPLIFSAAQALLLRSGDLDSFRYLMLSAILLGLSLFPFCLFMGMTFPFAAAFIKRFDRQQRTAFSYLYLANVLGAMTGVIAAAYFLIELNGLAGTLQLAVFCNFFIALVSMALHRHYVRQASAAPVEEIAPAPSIATHPANGKSGIYLPLLFMTGFVSMGMEVVWTRAFTPVLSTTIYSFASILAVYFLATWVGSWLYRRQSQSQKSIEVSFLIGSLAIFSLLPVALADPRLPLNFSMKAACVRLSIFPFCGLLGYLTPKLIDEFSAGDPRAMGRVYAVNIIGCIFGPLFAAYALLPAVGVRFSLIILSVPFFIFYGHYFKSAWIKNRGFAACVALLSGILFIGSSKVFLSYEDAAAFILPAVVRRDYAATVISYGSGMKKMLLVNGIGMTRFTPVTKMMAHVPLAIRDKKPSSACVICLGMGTSFRSAASWDIDTTAVELVPGVRDAFGFYFEDADEILRKPNARIIVDDGRRFLMRTAKKYDVITLDPSPPVTSSFSSLLYSQDFYRIVKTRLREGGILAQWFPAADTIEVLAVAKAIAAEFSYVRAYSSIEGWGVHFFASEQYFEMPDIETFVARLPKKAAEDLIEWNEDRTPGELYGIMLRRKIPLKAIVSPDFKFSITDDRPFNEYFYVRDLLRAWVLQAGGILMIEQELPSFLKGREF
jgi:spermidine synthase